MSLTSFLTHARSRPGCSILYECSCSCSSSATSLTSIHCQSSLPSHFPLSQLHYCPSCTRLCCVHCQHRQVDTHYCSSCLHSVFSQHASTAQQRCDTCVDCPVCTPLAESTHPQASIASVPPPTTLHTHVDQLTQLTYLSCHQCTYDSRRLVPALTATDAPSLLAKVKAHETALHGSSNNQSLNARQTEFEKCVDWCNNQLSSHTASSELQPYTQHVLRQSKVDLLLNDSAHETIDAFVASRKLREEEMRKRLWRAWEFDEDDDENANEKERSIPPRFDEIPSYLVTGKFESSIQSIENTLPLHAMQHMPPLSSIDSIDIRQQWPRRHRLSTLLASRCTHCSRYTVKPSPAVTKAAFEINHNAIATMPQLTLQADSISDAQMTHLRKGRVIALDFVMRNPLERNVKVTLSSSTSSSSSPSSQSTDSIKSSRQQTQSTDSTKSPQQTHSSTDSQSIAAGLQCRLNELLTGDANVRQRRPVIVIDHENDSEMRGRMQSAKKQHQQQQMSNKSKPTVEWIDHESKSHEQSMMHLTLPAYDELNDQLMYSVHPNRASASSTAPTSTSTASSAAYQSTSTVMWSRGCSVGIRLQVRLIKSDDSATSASASADLATATASSFAHVIHQRLWFDLEMNVELESNNSAAASSTSTAASASVSASSTDSTAPQSSSSSNPIAAAQTKSLSMTVRCVLS